MNAAPAHPSEGRAAAEALTRREITRFLRQPSRIAATVGTPVLMWIFIASGLSGSFASPSAAGAGAADSAPAGLTAFLLPGVITMTLMFSAVFGAISLIQDRHSGFLQAVLVSRAPSWSIVASKVLGCGVVAALQGALLLLAAPFVGLQPGVLGLLAGCVACALTACAIVALGLALAWKVDSLAGFHGVMNMVLMPLWLLSGAVFPVQGAADWLRHVVVWNPMHWCHSALAWSMGWPIVISPIAAWGGTLGFALAMVMLAGLAMSLGRGTAHRTGAE